MSRLLRARGIFDGQHEEDCTSLFNPTFMDDMAVLVEGDTPEEMLAKLSSALQTVKEVCQENAITLNMSVGKTGAIVLIQGKQAKEVKRRMFAEGEEDAAILETPTGPLRVVSSSRHLGCRVDPYTHPKRRIGGQAVLSSGSHSCAGALSSRGPGQSQRRSGRAWRGPQSIASSSTKLESGRA